MQCGGPSRKEELDIPETMLQLHHCPLTPYEGSTKCLLGFLKNLLRRNSNINFLLSLILKCG